MRKYILVIIHLVCIAVAIPGFCQDNKWLAGAWNGVYFGEKSKLTKTFDTRLQIVKVNGSQFEGVVQCILPSDTTIRLHTRITGRIYNDHIMTKLKEVVYFKDPPGQYTWAKNCNLCDSMKYTFEKQGDSVVLQGERKCDTLCNIVARYSKHAGLLVYKPAFLYEPDITPRRLTAKTAGTSFNFIKPIYKDSMVGRDFIAGRAVTAPARYVINADSAEIRLMDNGVVDGDTISIFYNGQLIVQKLGLKEKPFIIKVPLFQGYPNRLIVYAESLGTFPPNTALVRVLYGKKEENFLLSSSMSKSGSVELYNPSDP
ncbi:hypothetical protein FAM09_14310 [Niastella caeni]|uniref:Uncharacterized protein n=1 Tax=Niastella caeni TaxID=2569763 RepID=A0A4V4H197_9BACT|nr:hypothetical protein [Niastella caeni]THU39666.1 hypothetical protein FAM09_14310 [Niastella caeni]